MDTDARTNAAAAARRALEPREPVAPSRSVGPPAVTDDSLLGLSVQYLQAFVRKWRYLWNQEGFRHAPVSTLFRLISWRIKCLLRSPASVSLDRCGVQMFLPAKWRGVEKVIFAFRDDYEPELDYLREVLFPGMTFVDAGACYGIYTLAASKVVGRHGRVIAFEPASRAFRVLQKNIVRNGLTNVVAYPLALTDAKGKARLYHHPNVGCDSLGRDHSFTETSEEVKTESLDNVLRKISSGRVDVIKMDVQGAEELVLRGAEKALKSYHPVVIFEVYPECTVPLGLSSYGAWELLASLGYEFFVVDRGVLQRKVSPPADRNVVAIHKHSPAPYKSRHFTQSKSTGRVFGCVGPP